METTRRVFYAPLNARDDLKLLLAGTMVDGRASGPRPYFLVHYVVSGRGTVTVADRMETLSAGDIFVHRPGSAITYEPVADDPWTYCWMGFDGVPAEDWATAILRTAVMPVRKGEYREEVRQLFDELIASLSHQSMATTLIAEATMRMILERLLRVFGSEVERNRATTAELTARRAKEFMLAHYSEGITVTDVCHVSGYERTYFSNLFRQQTGQSLRDYLSSIRITQACKLLRTTELTVDAIAQQVGYTEYRAFSRCFKKIKGQSPRRYREEND